MILLYGTGKLLEARQCGPVIFRLTADAVPIKRNGWALLEDAVARAELRELLASGLYLGGKIELASD